MENSLSVKTKVLMFKRGGHIRISEGEADLAQQAMLAGDDLAEIAGQVFRANEIAGILDPNTYQHTLEARQEREDRTETNLPTSKTECGNCDGSGFLDDPTPRFANGIEYGSAVIPCQYCNTTSDDFSARLGKRN